MAEIRDGFRRAGGVGALAAAAAGAGRGPDRCAGRTCGTKRCSPGTVEGGGLELGSAVHPALGKPERSRGANDAGGGNVASKSSSRVALAISAMLAGRS